MDAASRLNSGWEAFSAPSSHTTAPNLIENRIVMNRPQTAEPCLPIVAY